MAILVTGGAGYIGSHVVKELLKKGYKVVVYDSLENGHKEAVPKEAIFVKGNIKEREKLANLMKKYKIEAVMNFAGYIVVPESVRDPFKYYENNLANTLKILEAMKLSNVNKIVFSSSAAVYGDPEKVPIMEDSVTKPKNPYGESKLIFEQMLSACDLAYGIKSVSLRYFNAAGADPQGEIGEEHDPETHLIPLILKAAISGKPVKVFGTDYPTKDGTCIRDYIHVTDLAQAHILAVEHLLKGGQSKIFNLGSGNGFSVKEMIDAAKKVTGISILVETAPRREGDPAKLVASSERIKKELGWKPVYSDIKTIILHAWNWHKNHSNGYNK